MWPLFRTDLHAAPAARPEMQLNGCTDLHAAAGRSGTDLHAVPPPTASPPTCAGTVPNGLACCAPPQCVSLKSVPNLKMFGGKAFWRYQSQNDF